ncbi:MAG: nucleotidyltransferase family protein [Methyloceanibacter sp.]
MSSPSPREGLQIAGVVLAAGRSSRMAPLNKLLEKIGVEPIVRRVAAVALASGAHPIIVVTGHEASRVTEALKGLEVTTVRNSSYSKGLSTSLRAGLGALPAGIDGAFVCLGDMPEVEGPVLGALMAAFAANGPRAICVPVRNGRRGNPVLWGASHFAEIVDISGDNGAKPVIARHEDCVIEVQVLSDSIFADVDAPQDLIRLKTKFGARA